MAIERIVTYLRALEFRIVTFSVEMTIELNATNLSREWSFLQK